MKRLLDVSSLVPFSVHLKVFGGLLTLTSGFKVTEENCFNALKLLKSSGETPKINGRRFSSIIPEMPRLASKVTEIRTRNYKTSDKRSTIPCV